MAHPVSTTGSGDMPLPLSLIAQAIPRLSRHDLAALADRMIDHLDQMDGDPDQEDATDLEDDWTFSAQATGYLAGPGCPIADAGGQCDEDGINTSNGMPYLHGNGYNYRGPGCTISDEDCDVAFVEQERTSNQ